MKKNSGIIKWVFVLIMITLVLTGIVVLISESNIKVKSYNAVVNIDSYGNMEI